MSNKITFDSLPGAVSEILEKTNSIIGLLSTNVIKTNNISKVMDKEGALLYLEQKGYKMSVSTLYKMTRNQEIPCVKYGNRLCFNSHELDKWLEEIALLQIHQGESTFSPIISHAQKQIKK